MRVKVTDEQLDNYSGGVEGWLPGLTLLCSFAHLDIFIIIFHNNRVEGLARGGSQLEACKADGNLGWPNVTGRSVGVLGYKLLWPRVCRCKTRCISRKLGRWEGATVGPLIKKFRDTVCKDVGRVLVNSLVARVLTIPSGVDRFTAC